jgi:Secretion system C-terminal sorting domain/Domain of unknown function (DUF4886)
MKNLILIFLLIITYSITNSQTTNVLFIGNSATGYQPMIFQEFAKEVGYDLLMKKNIWFGHTLEEHLGNSTTLEYIDSEDWDFVIAQGSDYAVAFPEYHYVIEDTYKKFIDLTLTNNPETKIIFFMPWCFADSVELLDEMYSPNEFHEIIESGTMQFAREYNLIVSPVGKAFNYVLNNHPEINCYDTDKVHPSPQGSFLAACVYFYLIFGEKTENYFTYISSLTTEEANLLQDIAEDIVLSDYEYWYLRTDTLSTKKEELKFTESQIDLFPNPANNTIHINISDVTSDFDLTIYNIFGTRVKHFRNMNASNEINTTFLSEGIYIAEIVMNNHRITKKFMIKR